MMQITLSSVAYHLYIIDTVDDKKYYFSEKATSIGLGGVFSAEKPSVTRQDGVQPNLLVRIQKIPRWRLTQHIAPQLRNFVMHFKMAFHTAFVGTYLS